MKKMWMLCCVVLLPAVGVASPLKFTAVEGFKYPNSVVEGTSPVRSTAWAPTSKKDLTGFNELVPYVTPSPDQEDAGTCLYMSMTGVAELWLHKLSNTTTFIPDGNLDLSERWWANLSRWSDHNEPVNNPYTDTILMFNTSPSVLNRDYRFAKGWYTETKSGEVKPVAPHTPGASYDTGINWYDDTDHVRGPRIKMPKFSRKVIFEVPGQNPWSIGVAPENIVEQVKAALVTYKAPVQVVYNHEGYWHSVFVVGYDDKTTLPNCPFIQESFLEFQKEADESGRRADSKRQKKYLRYKSELETAFNNGGGCNSQGVFYVRDSQYSDPSEPIYRYDLEDRSGDRPYSKRIIYREYEWLRHMANHVTVITAK